MVHNIRTKKDIEAKFEYIPPAYLKIGDEVTVDHGVRWGFPLDFDVSTPLPVTKESFRTKVGWTATVTYDDADYEIWENALRKVEQE